jgi:3,4-dihydroxy 2-butanone 4-phosphate synthase / GTP cyclohydrolase II
MQAVSEYPWSAIEEALHHLRRGRFVVMTDGADRTNQGNLMIAAQFATPDAITFMARDARGLICLCLTPERCDELDLRQMTSRSTTRFGTAFTVSIDAREGITTGISSHDRSRTVQVAIDPSRGAGDLLQPGHVFPLRARPGGVLERPGQTEAAVDLARLAGVNPAAVACEVMNEDGTMARGADLVTYCDTHRFKMVTVDGLITFRRRAENHVTRLGEVRLPTEYGEFTAVAFQELLTDKHHIALVKGKVEGAENVLVRIHSECLTGHTFRSLLCDCREQLELAFRRIAAEERGVLLYLAQERDGIGPLSGLKADALQENMRKTFEANIDRGFPSDMRDYGIRNQIVADLGLSTNRILTTSCKSREFGQAADGRLVGEG